LVFQVGSAINPGQKKATTSPAKARTLPFSRRRIWERDLSVCDMSLSFLRETAQNGDAQGKQPPKPLTNCKTSLPMAWVKVSNAFAYVTIRVEMASNAFACVPMSMEIASNVFALISMMPIMVSNIFGGTTTAVGIKKNVFCCIPMRMEKLSNAFQRKATQACSLENSVDPTSRSMDTSLNALGIDSTR
jgi:hypothetical protein